ncbi:MAG: sigma-54-dependent Fis family transcriptional regulator [Deltaproteobacteria bacterium]|nr:sigma-54-dependent Fis family transcriptional regulator [Deltaproteobacteria bacterium]
MSRPRILVLDGDQAARSRLRDELIGAGLDAADVASADEALAAVPSFRPDGLVVGVGSGVAGFLHALRSGGSQAPVVLVAGAEELPAAVQALRLGAESFVPRPASGPHVAVALEKALAGQRLRQEAAQLRQQARGRQAIVGGTQEIQTVHEVIRRAGPTKATVLIQGETGTGRELAAQAIHEASPRRDGPFVRVSCAGLSEPLVESQLFGHEAGVIPHAPWRAEGAIAAAAGGTLFLHEVSSLPAQAQVRLLRFLQHGEYERLGGTDTQRADVRVVASTMRDLADEVHRGRFRDDLYYRLSVVSLALPPLRSRKADIPALAEHFLSRAVRARGGEPRAISPGVLSALYAYEWPGNVRELAAALEAAVERSPGREIGTQHLPPVLQGAGPDDAGSALIPGATLAEIEREAILRTLEEVAGSTARAAHILGISVRKIQYKLKEYRGGHLGRRRRPGDPQGLPRAIGSQ